MKRQIAITGLLFLLCSAWVCAQEVYTDNVVIVLDASGSMRETMKGTRIVKMTAAKQALHQVLQHVPETTHIGLLVFSSANVKDPWVYPLGPRDEMKLKAAIDLPQPKGGTPLGKFIKKGADRLLEEREKQHGYGSYRLLVVTDGEAGDKSFMKHATGLLLQRGVITLDVIGVDMAGRHTLATQSHSYRQANDPESLTRAVQEVFAEISTTDGSDADAEAFAEIAPLPANFAADVLKALGTTGNQPLGEMSAAQSKAAKSQSSTSSQTSHVTHTQHSPGAHSHPAPPSRKKPIFTILIVLIVIFGVIKGVVKRR